MAPPCIIGAMRLPILSLLLLLPRAARPDAALFTNPAPIQVTAPRAAPAAGTAGWDTAAWLERVPLVSVRQQGLGGAQGDLSVRGGAFNTSGLLYKSMELKSKLPDMNEDEMLQLLSTDGMLVKRPLLIGDEFVLVGFKEDEWARCLKTK